MDFELEFGVFLGRGGADIATGKARANIFFGFAIGVPRNTVMRQD